MWYNYSNYKKGDFYMALIVCPECGGTVSDKAKACIHCGYPIQEIKNRSYNLILTQVPANKVKVIGVMRHLITSMSLIEARERIESIPPVLFSGLRDDNADYVLEKLHVVCTDVIKEESSEAIDENLNAIIDAKKQGVDIAPVVCPKCGSTQIVFIPKKIGHGSYDYNRCQKCGYKWPLIKHLL